MAQINIEKDKVIEKAAPGTPAAAAPVEKAAEKPVLVAPPREFHPLRMLRRLMRGDPFAALESFISRKDEGGFEPTFNIKESDQAFIMTADIPGVAPKDLDVELTQNRLTVRGHKEQEKEEKGETYYTFERSFGAFERTLTIPAGVDGDKIAADLKDGVLTVTIPKIVETPPKKVDVKAP
jgi:HSP20 family protein